MSLTDNLVEDLAKEYADKRAREKSRRLAPYYLAAPGQPSEPAPGLEGYALTDEAARNFEAYDAQRARERFQTIDTSAGPTIPFGPPRTRITASGAERPITEPFGPRPQPQFAPGPFEEMFGPVDPETARLASIDRGSVGGEPPFPGYERGVRAAGSVGAAALRPIGQEKFGRKVGELAFRGIVPSTPAELAAALATGGMFGETTVAGQALRAQAKKAGRSVRVYAASAEGKAAIRRLASESGQFDPSWLSKKIDEAEQTAAMFDEHLEGRALTPEDRAAYKAGREVERQRIAALQDIEARGAPAVPGEHEATALNAVDDEIARIENELTRRSIPFGGRAGISAAQQRRMIRAGKDAQFTNAFKDLTTPQLNARREALRQLKDELPQALGAPDVLAPETAAPVARVVHGDVLHAGKVVPGTWTQDVAAITDEGTFVPDNPDAVARARYASRDVRNQQPSTGPGELVPAARPAPPEPSTATPEPSLRGGGAGEAPPPTAVAPPPEDISKIIINAVHQNTPLRVSQVTPRSEQLGEKARRIAAIRANKTFTPAQRSAALAQAASGELYKADFSPLQITPEQHVAAVAHITASANISEFDYLRLLGTPNHPGALDKLLAGQGLQRNEENLLAKAFGPEMERALKERGQQSLEANITNAMQPPANVGPVRAGVVVLDNFSTKAVQRKIDGMVHGALKHPKPFHRMTTLQKVLLPLQLLRTVKTSFDIGWGGRQGWRLLPSNSGEWFSMFGKQFKAFKNEANFEEIDAAARAFPNFERSQKAARPLAYLERGTGNPEHSGEEFLSPLTKHIPGLSGSERAYVGPGNWMRQAVLDGDVVRVERATGAPVTDADFQRLIDNLNNATLRGNTKWLGRTNAQTLASTLFSLKGVASGPQFALDFLRVMRPGVTPEVRKIIAQRFGAYVATGMGTLGIAAAMGYGVNKAGIPVYVKVDLDKDSRTFGQINVGGFRWNYWGNDQPLVRYALAVSQGQEQPRGLAEQDASRLRLTKNFVRSKIAPGPPSLIWDTFVNDGRGYGGQEIWTKTGGLLYALDQVEPLFFSNALDAYKNLGPAAVVPSLLAEESGLSTATYDLAPTDKQLKADAKNTVNQHLKPFGARTEGGLIEFREWDEMERVGVKGIADTLGATHLGEFKTLAEFKAAYRERMAPLLVSETMSLPEAKDAIDKVLNRLQPIKDIGTARKNYRLQFWRAHPDLLIEAVELGIEDTNPDERKIIDEYRKSQQIQGGINGRMPTPATTTP